MAPVQLISDPYCLNIPELSKLRSSSHHNTKNFSTASLCSPRVILLPSDLWHHLSSNLEVRPESKECEGQEHRGSGHLNSVPSEASWKNLVSLSSWIGLNSKLGCSALLKTGQVSIWSVLTSFDWRQIRLVAGYLSDAILLALMCLGEAWCVFCELFSGQRRTCS